MSANRLVSTSTSAYDSQALCWLRCSQHETSFNFIMDVQHTGTLLGSGKCHQHATPCLIHLLPMQVKSEQPEVVQQQWQTHCDSIRSKLATAGTVCSHAVSHQLEELAAEVKLPSDGLPLHCADGMSNFLSSNVSMETRLYGQLACSHCCCSRKEKEQTEKRRLHLSASF